jgi:hypothetical protein
VKNHSSNDSAYEALPFSPFTHGIGAGDGAVFLLERAVSRLGAKGSQQIMPSFQRADRQAVARPIVPRRVVSRYDVDLYGRPRILSPLEATLHALAWPVMLGVAIGFGIAIGAIAIHNTSKLPSQEKADARQVTPHEEASL